MTTTTNSNLYDLDSAFRIFDLLDEGVDLETALATEKPIGKVEMTECLYAFYGVDTEFHETDDDGGDD